MVTAILNGNVVRESLRLVERSRMPKGKILAWTLYDWATSGYGAVIATFVFSVYFTQEVWDGDGGAVAWGWMVSLTSIFVGIGGSLLGLKFNGIRTHRSVLTIFIIISTITGMGLWFIKPEPEYAILALLLVGIGSFCVETSFVPYNTLLRVLVPPERAGRVSANAWGLGYVGGVVCLLLALPIIQSGIISDINLANVRAASPFAALWLFVFALPMIISLYRIPQERMSEPGYATSNLNKNEIIQLLKHRGIWKFLLSRLFLAEGLTALFAFGGIIAASLYDFSTEKVLLFAIALNISAGVGAIPGGHLDDRFGPRMVINTSLVGLILCGAVIGFTEGELIFWIASISLGLFIGPVQSSGRSLVAKSVSKEEAAPLYGLLGFSGRVVSFIGPLFVTIGISITDNDRTAIWVIAVLLIISLIIMLSTPKSIGQIETAPSNNTASEELS